MEDETPAAVILNKEQQSFKSAGDEIAKEVEEDERANNCWSSSSKVSSDALQGEEFVEEDEEEAGLTGERKSFIQYMH